MKLDKEHIINRLAYVDMCMHQVMQHNMGNEDYKVLQKASQVIDNLTDYVRHPNNGHYGISTEK